VLIQGFFEIISLEAIPSTSFDFTCSPGSLQFLEDKVSIPIAPILVNKEWNSIIKKYDLVISLHCKQLFPADMIRNVRCINIHPGLNPYNRGWFPQVFSILNGLPIGATIHEIDEKLDHGNIIVQKQTTIEPWETSKDVYDRILQLELELLKEHLPSIILGQYNSIKPIEEGNLNLKKNFDELCQLDLNEQLSFRQAIDRLRALTHEPYKNAYYIDSETGDRVYISVDIEREKNE
jgi:methionyl-tRNA formyltransferase